MAKEFFEDKTAHILKNINESQLLVQKGKLLVEDMQGEILLIIERVENSKKLRSPRKPS